VKPETETDTGRVRAELTSDEFRRVVGHFASGVTVITTVDNALRYGTTASAFSSLSVEPPMLLVALNRTSETGAAVATAGRFAVNILAEDQEEVALRFARKGSSKFDGVPVSVGHGGLPLIDGALATLQCHVTSQASGGTHTVFLAEVVHAQSTAGTPLAYWRGRFGRLELVPEVDTRQPQQLEDALRARTAIILAAAIASAGRPSSQSPSDAILEELAQALAAPVPLAHVLTSVNRFDARLIASGGIKALEEAYARLPAVSASPAGPQQWMGTELVELHSAVLEAHKRGDVAALARAFDARTKQLASLMVPALEADSR